MIPKTQFKPIYEVTFNDTQKPTGLKKSHLWTKFGKYTGPANKKKAFRRFFLRTFWFENVHVSF